MGIWGSLCALAPSRLSHQRSRKAGKSRRQQFFRRFSGMSLEPLEERRLLAINIADNQILEGNSGTQIMPITVTLTAPRANTVTVQYQTSDLSPAFGAATSGSDYSGTSGTLTFAPGETSKTFNVTIFGDQVFEPNETFFVTLSNPTGGETIGDGVGQFTIINDDVQGAATISVGDVTIQEPSAGTALATFTIQLDRTSTQEIAVSYQTVSDTATSPEDYTGTAGQVLFAPGQLTQQVSVVVNADDIDEINERFFFRISTSAGSSVAVIGDGEAIATIIDDPNDGPTVSISDAVITEPDFGTQAMAFTVTLDRTTTQEVRVRVATREALGGGKIALDGIDFQGRSEELIFAPGETSKQFLVNIIGDNIYESPSELFEVVVVSASGATIGDDVGVGTIVDNDPRPRIIVLDRFQPEGNAGVTVQAFADSDPTPGGPFTRRFGITIVLSNPSDEPISAQYQVLSETATVGDVADPTTDVFRSNPSIAGDGDFDLVGSIFFAPGQTSTGVNLRTRKDFLNNQIVEQDETFIFDLFDPVNAEIERDGRMTIVDDDGVVGIQLPVEPVVITEGSGGRTFVDVPVLAFPTFEEVVTVNYRLVSMGEAMPGADYIDQTGTIVFPGNWPPSGGTGFQERSVRIEIIADFLDEIGGGLNGGERFMLEIFNPSSNAVISNSTAIITILDDDGPTLSISDAVVTEGNPSSGISGVTGEAVVFVTLSSASTQTVTVNYATQNGSALSGIDYVITPTGGGVGTLVFAPGETVKEIRIPIIGDFATEGEEFFNVVLSNAVNAQIVGAPGRVTIQDDDIAPVISVLSVEGSEPSSGASSFLFPVRLSTPSNQVVSVQFFTQSGSAFAGTDFSSTSGVITFQPGELEKFISVPVIQDGDDTEGTETFTVHLINPTNAIISDTQATAVGTIRARPLPTLSINDVEVLEGDGGVVQAVFTVTLTGETTDEVRVQYSTRDGSATGAAAPGLGVDYINTSGELVFAPGDTQKQIVIEVLGDDVVESLENFFIDLFLPVEALIADGVGEGRIRDDDNQPPTIVTPIPDRTILEDSAPTEIDLSPFFDDPELIALTFSVSSNSAPSLVQATVSGSILRLTPLPNRFGVATITVRATDNAGQFVEDTFSVIVRGVNDAPTLNPIPDQAPVLSTAGPQVVLLSGISPGGNEDALQGQTVAVLATSSNPSVVPNPVVTYTGGTTATLTYTPVPGAFGTATITVTVVDTGGTADGGVDRVIRTFTVQVQADSTSPIAVDDAYTYVPNTPLTIGAPGVLTNDSNPGGGSLTAVLFDVPQHGRVVVNANGSFTYTPDPGYNGFDSFKYVARSNGEETVATVRLESTDFNFVRKLYAEPDLLNRSTPPTDNEVAFWVGEIPRIGYDGVVSAFVASRERRSRIINDLYVQYIGRPVDAAGLNYWLGVWDQSRGPEPIQAGIIGSLEFYFNTAGGDAQQWVQLLYQNILGRSANTQEVNYWANLVLNGANRSDIVTGFVTSDEYRLQLIDGWYNDYLNRQSDSAGRLYWLDQMRRGLPQESIQIGFLASFEYRTTA